MQGKLCVSRQPGIAWISRRSMAATDDPASPVTAGLSRERALSSRTASVARAVQPRPPFTDPLRHNHGPFTDANALFTYHMTARWATWEAS